MKRDPFAAAERKGRQAARAGKARTDCPYQDTRKRDGRLTFARAWRNAWLNAFDSECFNMRVEEFNNKGTIK